MRSRCPDRGIQSDIIGRSVSCACDVFPFLVATSSSGPACLTLAGKSLSGRWPISITLKVSPMLKIASGDRGAGLASSRGQPQPCPHSNRAIGARTGSCSGYSSSRSVVFSGLGNDRAHEAPRKYLQKWPAYGIDEEEPGQQPGEHLPPLLRDGLSNAASARAVCAISMSALCPATLW